MALVQPFRVDSFGPQRRELGDDAPESRRQTPHHELGLEPEHSIPDAPQALITPGVGS
jgi:hypothetical protein